jgi:hypothetical protein
MKEYKFVSVEIKKLQLSYTNALEKCKEEINQHALEGWSLVQVINFSDASLGTYLEIIFEKDVV